MRAEVHSKKTKAHTRYHLPSGEQIPGVTTITEELGWKTRALVKWGNKLGLQGVDSTKYVDEKADIGTLAHRMVEDYLLGEKKADYREDYSDFIIDKAENSFLSFLKWAEDKTIKPIFIEKPFISVIWRFGGTIDFYGEVNGGLELIDLKSGAGLYDEHTIQAAAYRVLLMESGNPVTQVRILNIPRTEDEAFTEKIITPITSDIAFDIFTRCLDIYRLKKGLKNV